MAEKTQPTDAELDSIDMDAKAIANQNPIGTPFAWRKAYLTALARAVLARFGQPAHSGEPVAWLSPWRADQVTTDYDAYGEHGIALYTAPQPSPAVQGDARSMLRIVADYSDWLDSKDRLTSFSTFVNEFGYEERDCKSVYEIVVVPCLAARAAQEGKSHE